VVLLNYLLPRDVLKAMTREKVTGLTAVPPLYIQPLQLDWPEEVGQHLRYFANTGGRMPRETPGPLPRNPNGKIDRKLLATGWVERHS
jgi:acyl-CoA synthetase (AMP-forming)/AMP-acid ligase II